MESSDSKSRFSASAFDGRADDFDRRSAPPKGAAVDIARAVDAVARDAGGGALLDLGAGTGVLGAPLARLWALRGAAYVGLDLSLGMLARFRSRLAHGDGVSILLRADASRPWPLEDGSVGAVFAARAAHLFDPEALLREVRRVAAPGGVLLLGAVRRDRDAPRAVLRRQLHRLLAEHGIEPRSARRRHGEISQLFGGRDLASATPEVVASWTVTESLHQALAAWRRPGHLAGRDVSDSIRREVLDTLHVWALDRWAAGRYDADHDSEAIHLRTLGPQTVELQTIERFELTSIRLAQAD